MSAPAQKQKVDLNLTLKLNFMHFELLQLKFYIIMAYTWAKRI